jgi:hypothetical protein
MIAEFFLHQVTKEHNMEESLRQRFGIPDSAILIPKAEDLMLRPGADGLANIGFRNADGSSRRICKVAGNHIFFKDDIDNGVKFIDEKWIMKDGIFRPAATRFHINADPVTGDVQFSMLDKSFVWSFPGTKFEINGDVLEGKWWNMNVKLWARSGTFHKVISGTGMPDFPIENGNFLLRIPFSGLPSRAAGKELKFGAFNFREAELWEKSGKRRLPIKQSIVNINGSLFFQKELPVSFFSIDTEWETDATSYYTTAGDGHVQSRNASFATARSSAGTLFLSGTSTVMEPECDLETGLYSVYRAFCPTDTSGIGAGQVVTACDAKLYITNHGTPDSGTSVIWTNTTQANVNTLATTDHALMSLAASGGSLAISSITNNTTHTITGNSNAIGWVNTTGYSKFGFTTSLDYNNTAPTSFYNYADIATSESANDEYFDITYSASSSAISVDASSSVTLGHTSPRTFSHTCTGPNRLLRVGVATNNDTVTGDQVTGVTYNGVAMTQIDKLTIDSFGCLYLFELAGPASGSNTVSVSFNNASDASISAVATSYAGAAQSAYDAKTTASQASNTSITATLTTVADNAWVSGVFNMFGAGTAGAGTVKRVENASNLGMYDSNAPKTPAGSISIIATRGTNGNLKAIVASLAPYGNGPATSGTRLNLLGVG